LLRQVGVGGASWLAGNGIAVRIDELRTADGEAPLVYGNSVSAYDVRTGALLETESFDGEPSLSAIPGSTRLVLEYDFCGCRCGLTSEPWPPPPTAADPAASL
jgi:hypothetical protein